MFTNGDLLTSRYFKRPGLNLVLNLTSLKFNMTKTVDALTVRLFTVAWNTKSKKSAHIIFAEHEF